MLAVDLARYDKGSASHLNPGMVRKSFGFDVSSLKSCWMACAANQRSLIRTFGSPPIASIGRPEIRRRRRSPRRSGAAACDAAVVAPQQPWLVHTAFAWPYCPT
jgi:hypothetical protein